MTLLREMLRRRPSEAHVVLACAVGLVVCALLAWLFNR